jgi:hypothetical protein
MPPQDDRHKDGSRGDCKAVAIDEFECRVDPSMRHLWRRSGDWPMIFAAGGHLHGSASSAHPSRRSAIRRLALRRSCQEGNCFLDRSNFLGQEGVVTKKSSGRAAEFFVAAQRNV